MKKIFLVLGAVILFGSLKAQMDITVGPKFGFNVSNVTNMDHSKNKISFQLGGFAEFKFNDFFAVQPELLYSRQGFRTKEGDTKHKYRVNYLNIPVLAKLYVLDDLSVDFGPQFGFALNAKSVAKAGGTTTKVKMNSMVNTFDLSFAIGASYELDMGLMLSARYNLGLTNVYDEAGGNKNHLFQLSAGWRFSDLF